MYTCAYVCTYHRHSDARGSTCSRVCVWGVCLGLFVYVLVLHVSNMIRAGVSTSMDVPFMCDKGIFNVIQSIQDNNSNNSNNNNSNSNDILISYPLSYHISMLVPHLLLTLRTIYFGLLLWRYVNNLLLQMPYRILHPDRY